MSFAEIAVIANLLLQTQTALPPEEVGCLARNIYHEARAESVKGQLAVAHVTINRKRSSRFPDTICDVVHHDKGPKKHDCQFSWTCDGRSDVAKEIEAFELAVLLSIEVLKGRSEDPTAGSEFYVAKSALGRKWVKNLDQVARIGDHFFMRRRK